MRFRKLRIACTVFCAIVCVLLIVLWVRSYWRLDAIAYKHPPRLSVWLVSSNGELRCEIERKPANVSVLGSDVDNYYAFVRPTLLDPERANGSGILGFRLLGGNLAPVPVIPHWFAITVFGTLGIVVGCVRFQFSLRTLLIATALVAVVLGLIVWLR
jgi:hypothetical protein